MGIHLALLQTDIKFCDFEYNAAHVKEMIADAMEKVPRPDVIVLPEDWSSGFSDAGISVCQFWHIIRLSFGQFIERFNLPNIRNIKGC